MTIYSWKPKASVGIGAQVAGDAIEAIRQRHGGVTPALIVNDARPAEAALHPAFEWDDALAAEKWREDQARYVLRSLVTVSSERNAEPTMIRAFVTVRDDGDQQIYTSIAHAMSDAELRRQIVERAWKELQDWRKRYEEYEELAGVVAAIEAQQPGKKAA